jgi:hypothetical protein
MSSSHSFNLLRGKKLFGGRVRKPHWSALVTVGQTTLVVLALAAVAALPLAALATPVILHATRGQDAVMAAVREAEAGEFALAAVKADTAAREFEAALAGAERLGFLSYAPVLGGYVTAAGAFMETGASGASAFADLMLVAVDMGGALGEADSLRRVLMTADISAVFSDLTSEARQRLLAAFVANVPRLRDAAEKTSLAVVAFDRVPDDGPGGSYKRRLMPLRDRLDQVRAVLAAGLPAVESLPTALGFPEERHYLVFFQNNTELRPTGGFLGVYGLMTVKDAEIVSLVTDDVYALDGPSETRARPTPPEPISRYLGVSKWYLRDANWSPDFPTSAARMTQFFREEATAAWGADQVPEVSGVIVITPEAVADVLRVIGPVAADDLVFTPENFVELLEYEVEQGFALEGVPASERKGIIGRLSKNVMDRLSRATFDELAALVEVFRANAAEKHVMLWFADPILQARAVRNGWAGTLPPLVGDYVQVVDANLASLKTDAVVSRAVRYRIEPQDGGGYLGSVTATYRNDGSFTWKTTRYRTYTRVYVPPGSEFISVAGAMRDDKIKDPGRQPGLADVGEEAGRAWFGAFVSVEPGETRSLEFRFRLAPSVERLIEAGEYRLTAAKQPGTLAPGLTLDLNLGKNLRTADPAEPQSEWGDRRYRLITDLLVDRQFRVGFN